jgi:hypothetical protein
VVNKTKIMLKEMKIVYLRNNRFKMNRILSNRIKIMIRYNTTKNCRLFLIQKNEKKKTKNCRVKMILINS